MRQPTKPNRYSKPSRNSDPNRTPELKLGELERSRVGRDDMVCFQIDAACGGKSQIEFRVTQNCITQQRPSPFGFIVCVFRTSHHVATAIPAKPGFPDNNDALCKQVSSFIECIQRDAPILVISEANDTVFRILNQFDRLTNRFRSIGHVMSSVGTHARVSVGYVVCWNSRAGFRAIIVKNKDHFSTLYLYTFTKKCRNT